MWCCLNVVVCLHTWLKWCICMEWDSLNVVVCTSTFKQSHSMYPHHYIQAIPLHVSTPLHSSYPTPCIHTTTFKLHHSMYPHHYLQAISHHVSTPLHSNNPTPCIHTTTFKLRHFDMYEHAHVHTYVFPKEAFTHTCIVCTVLPSLVYSSVHWS